MSLFENTMISSEELPVLEKSGFERLESDYLYMRLTSRGLFFLVLAGVLTVLVFTTEVPAWMYFAPWLLLIIITFVLEIRGFGIKGFAIREKDVSYKSGLIWFSMTSIPFNRIQHCEVSQGPLGRLFDLASVKVYTAGGSSSDLVIRGLLKEKAHRLRDYITKLSAEYE
jgi:membrane protein YdbS with pleckstrin-like domain